MTPSLNTPIRGIDVSHFQCDLDWSAVRAANFSFAFVKATEGVTYIDPCFHKNWSSGHAIGLKMGAYHFYRSADDPIAQADFFLKNIKPFRSQFGLAPALDVETEAAAISKEEFSDNLLQWLEKVTNEWGTLPYLYCSYSFGNTYLTAADFSRYPLWIASYNRATPLIPNAWKNAGYKIWQKGSQSIGGRQVDMDVMS